MKTQYSNVKSLREHLNNSEDRSRNYLWGPSAHVCLGELLRCSSLGGRLAELECLSILLVTREQQAAALALLELDGIAGRIVICPPDLPPQHLPSVIEKAGIDAVVSDCELDLHGPTSGLLRIMCHSRVQPAREARPGNRATEWVLLTSGTTGAPKMIVHSLASLIAPVKATNSGITNGGDVWGTFYDIRRYGGLQIFLRAILGHGSMVLTSSTEPLADHLARLAAHGVTHLSGTPSHWRRALMSPIAHSVNSRYIRLSGEIADQGILNTLRACYPNSAVGHAFASTEAGVAFEVNDGLEGFPAAILEQRGDVELKIRNDSLLIRSNRSASRYLDAESGALKDEEGFVDTGDIVELRGDRQYFLGRRNGVINVGGLKVYPEEVESVINRHPAVRMSIVHPRQNSVTGSLVSADVVLKEDPDEPDPIVKLRSEILAICRQALPPYKIPATIQCVPMLKVASGKLVRAHA